MIDNCTTIQKIIFYTLLVVVLLLAIVALNYIDILYTCLRVKMFGEYLPDGVKFYKGI